MDHGILSPNGLEALYHGMCIGLQEILKLFVIGLILEYGSEDLLSRTMGDP
ncbi:MAG: hypothetical protein IJI41_14530 [Anaerolineaceae bacterium]|nr:hypothetical protein [Anaerolineaceae bacterium]